MKLRGLTEKWLLKKLGQKLVPEMIWNRYKRPYRAPIQRSFFSQKPPAYVMDLLSQDALRESGYFNPETITSLASKAQSGAKLSEVDDMALVGVCPRNWCTNSSSKGSIYLLSSRKKE